MKTSFSVIRKKTPFTKHKEQEEDKKRRANAEAAKLYEEFVESFKPENEEGGIKTFVRGEIVEPGTRVSDAKAGPQRGGKYIPSFMPPGMAEALANKGKKSSSKDDRGASVSTKPDKNKPRGIDMVMQEMKRDQEERAMRGSSGSSHKPGSGFDMLPGAGAGGGAMAGEEKAMENEGDPYTTNLYVGNLSPEVTEDTLKREFVRFGPIASVKIMWPRTDEERSRGRNCGFIAFMDRIAAMEAKDEMNNRMLQGYDLRIGWGKSVPLPAHPIWPPPGGEACLPGADQNKPMTPAEVAAAAAAEIGRRTGYSTESTILPTVVKREADPRLLALQQLPPNGPDIIVRLPEDVNIQHVIDVTAKYVLQDGCKFEQYIMEQERNNPDYEFLFRPQSKEHSYYRWRLFSLANGDEMLKWRKEPFQMLVAGPRWIPPPPEDNALAHQRAHRRQQAVDPVSSATAQVAGGVPAALGAGPAGAAATLTDEEADEFEDMLRGLSMERADVQRAMAFALDHAAAALDVVETVVESLTLAETPLPTKVARLYLVSDILHNSSAPVRNATSFRTHLETRLPEVFESLQEVRVGLGRITGEELKKRVLTCLRAWGDWFVFPEQYLTGLQATFLRPGPGTALSHDHSQLEAEYEELADEDLERKCRRNGISVKGGRTSMIPRLLALEEHRLVEKERALPKYTGLVPLEPTRAEAEALAGVRNTPSSTVNTPATSAPLLAQQPQEPGPQPDELRAAAVVESKPAALAGLIGGYASSEASSDDEDKPPPPSPARAPAAAAFPAGVGQGAFDDSGSRPKPPPTAAKSPTKSAGPKSRWTETESDEEGGADVAATETEEVDMNQAEEAAPTVGGRWADARAIDEDARKPISSSAVVSAETKEESEEERKRKRKFELAVLEFRTMLEDEGKHSRAEVESRVEAFRQKNASTDFSSRPSGKSSTASKDKDRERERDRAKSSGTKEKDRDREKDREKEKEREKERDRSRGSKRTRSKSPTRSSRSEVVFKAGSSKEKESSRSSSGSGRDKDSKRDTRDTREQKRR